MKFQSRERDAVESVTRIAIIAVVLGVAVLGLIVYGLWALARGASANALIWWAVIATLMILPVFFFGFYLGKVEARGLLHGFDRSLDRMADVIGNVVSVRDQSSIAVHNATKVPAQQPQWNTTLPGMPGMPVITHRQLGGGDNRTIDL